MNKIMVFLFFAITSCVKNKIPELISDVPVVRELPSTAYAKTLHIIELQAKVIQNKTNLFNSLAIVEYRVKGQMQGGIGWHPYIKNFMISKRWDFSSSPIGYIYLQPDVSTKKSKKYNNEPVDFEITLQDTIRSGGWGKNEYHVHAGNKDTMLSFFHGK